MLRLILLFVVAMLVAVGALAIALNHYFGWKWLIAIPFLMIAFAWMAKVVIKSLIRRFTLGLFGMKARALRGATIRVHSVKSVPKPPEPESEPEEDAGDVASAAAGGGSDEAVADETDETETEEVETPKDYVEVDVTITPETGADGSVWEPGELMLASEKIKSLADLEEKEVGTTHSVEIWNGMAFGPDDEGKYPGEQRLKITFQVKPGASRAWLHYYNEPLGDLTLPVGAIDV
jgi:hypothetical protein